MLGGYRRSFCLLSAAVSVVVFASSTLANLLGTQTFFLPSGTTDPNSGNAMDELVATTPLTTWSKKGAVGLQGNQSVFFNGSSFVNAPATAAAFKFNIGAAVDSLNSTFGAGNWTIANPKLAFQYTYYANNNIFGGGAGSFETYWVANDSWAFGNGAASGNSFGSFTYVPGTDPAYATDAATLQTWAGKEADLGSTTYNWLSPANNPNFTTWTIAKSGPNQGMLTANLTTDPQLASDITGATAASNANISLYLIPNDNTLGLTIFTGGGSVTPELSFDVISAPEPASASLAVLAGSLILVRRRKR